MFAVLAFLICFTAALAETPIQIFEAELSLIREPPPPLSNNEKAVETEWIEQRIDNFNPQNSDTYMMVTISITRSRYFIVS